MPAQAQDLEPRRWTPLPAGLNVVGAGYIATRGDVFLDPVLLVEDSDTPSIPIRGRSIDDATPEDWDNARKAIGFGARVTEAEA